MNSKVAIVILNWNGLKDTLGCLKSLRSIDYPNYEILVIDNASTDTSSTEIPKNYPDIQMLFLEENLGFVGGNNVGMRYIKERSDAEYVLLLNNDTVVSPDFLTRLVETMEVDDRVGIVSPLILYYDLPDTIWSAGGILDRTRWQTWMRMIGEKETSLGDSSTQTVDFVTGCCLLIRKTLIDEVGMLDDRFFAYYEDVEWCDRVSKAGKLIHLVPKSRIWHKVSPERRAASPIVHYYMTRNRLLFMKVAGANLLGFLRVIWFDYFRTLVSWSIRPKWRDKRPMRRGMIQAIKDAALGRWGKALNLS